MSDNYPFPWGPEPEGYVPGLGRGELGFVSYMENAVVEIEDESDIMMRPNEKRLAKEEKMDNDADDFYRSLEEKIATRNKSRKEVLKGEEKIRTVFDEVNDQFADLKQTLTTVSANDWENIPDIGVTKNYRPKWELLTYASGRMITGNFSESSLEKENRALDMLGADESELKAEKEMMSISRAKTSVMNTVLSKSFKKVSLDTSAFMHDLNLEIESRIDALGSIDEASKIYMQMSHSNKTDPKAWIMRVHIEERMHHFDKAKQIARKGLSYNLNSEEMVLEAVRLSNQNEASLILQAALKVNHANSEAIWLKYASVQQNAFARKTVLENALQALPTSPSIWIAAAENDEDQAMHLMRTALQFIPGNHDLIIGGFNNCQSPDDVQFFKSQIKEPTIELLFAQARAEEKFSLPFEETVKSGMQLNTTIDWVLEAQTCEKEGFATIAQCILKFVEYRSDFLELAQNSSQVGCLICAETLLQFVALNEGKWTPLLNFLKNNGNLQDTIQQIIDDNITKPSVVIQVIDFLDGESAVSVLDFALSQSPNSSILAIAYANRLAQNGEITKAIEYAKEASLRMKSVSLYSLLETLLGNKGDLAIYQRGVELFPTEPNMWLRLASMYQGKEKGKILQTAVSKCPNTGFLHIELIKTAKQNGLQAAQIRSLFESACRLCKNDEYVWLLATENEPIEHRIQMLESAKKQVNRPEVIWARHIEYLPPEQRLQQVKMVIEQLGEKRELLLVKALCEWRKTEIDKARETFKQITEHSPQWGDGWVFRLRFEQDHGSPEDYETTKKLISSVDLKSGFTWEAARADPEFFSLSNEALVELIVSEISDPTLNDSSIFGGLLYL